MTAIHAHRVGTQPFTRALTPLLGPNLPQAACKGATEPLWDFSVEGELPGQRTQRLERGTTICRTCPEREACGTARRNNPHLGAGLYGGGLVGRDSGESRRCRCGTTLPSSRHTREYCSKACRQVAYRERAERKAVA